MVQRGQSSLAFSILTSRSTTGAATCTATIAPAPAVACPSSEPNPLQSTLTTAGCSRSIPAVPCHPTDQLSPGAPPPSCVIPAKQHGLLSVKSSGVSSSSSFFGATACVCLRAHHLVALARTASPIGSSLGTKTTRRTLGRRFVLAAAAAAITSSPPRAAQQRAFHSSANSRLTRAHSSGVPVVRGDAVLSGGQPHVQRPRRSQPSSR